MKKLLFVYQKSYQSKLRTVAVKALSVFSCVLFSQNLSAQANPPVTPEYIMASGPYTNVENTSVHQEDVIGVPGVSTVQVYAWDGNRAAFAQTWGPGSTLDIQPLPIGAANPDIVVGANGTRILVAYEFNGDIRLHLYENAIGGGGIADLGFQTVLNASKPNLDKRTDCLDPYNDYAMVYEDNSGGNDILVAFGVFFPPFIAPSIAVVPTVSMAPVSDPYINRVNPDIMYIEDEIYVTAAGTNTNLGGSYVDIFYVPKPMFPFPTVTGLLNPGGPLFSSATRVYPRIDGIIYSSPNCYEFSLCYGDNNLIYNAYTNTSFGVISQAGSSNELPAVGFRGDYNDVIWTATGPGAYSNEVIGLGAVGCVKDPYYKQVNSTVGGGTINLFPNISGTCKDPVKNDYAMIWWEQNSANIYYKYSNAGTTNYKNGGSATAVENSVEADFPTLLSKGQFNWESNKQLELEIRNLSGQLVGIYSLEEFKSYLGNFENGLYIFKITDRTRNTFKVEKVLIKS